MQLVKSGLVLAMLSVSVALPAGVAQALPLSPVNGGNALAAQIQDTAPVVKARNGGAVAAGVIGGMILGGMIASQPWPYYYDYPPPYDPAYGAPYGYDSAIGYCMRRYRSYDPHSMTYLGYDGLRHSCP